MATQDRTIPYGLEPVPREHTSVLSVLRRRALIVIGVTILAAGAAAAFAYGTRDTYQSTSKLVVAQTIGPELNAIGLLPPSSDADNLSQSAVDLVGSRRVAAPTAAELRRRGVDMSEDDVVNNISVTNQKGGDIVTVVGTASSAKKAAQLTDVYSTTAARLAEDDTKRRAQRALTVLQQQYRELTPKEKESMIGPAAQLRNHIEKMKVIAAVGNGSPEIIQPAFVPTSKAGNPIQTILLGALFGLVLGIGLALLREQSDRRLHRAEDVSAAYYAPVLTTVPRHRALKRHRAFGDLPPEVAESFRMLQMNLLFGQNGPVNSVLVTSSRSREGKTTVAWNLASAAASSGRTVALVEADMRRPSMASRYGLEPSPGLAEALRGRVSVAAALQIVSPQPGNANINGYPRPMHVLVAGDPPPDPWALMQSQVMISVLEVLSRDHDFVVIDTPPIPHVADTISLLRRVDGVIVTASVNSTRGPEAERLRDQLQVLDARVLGVVANGGSAASGYAYVASTPTTVSTEADGGANGGGPRPE